MKQCSKCNKFYDDDTLNFCLDDGTSLSLISEAPTQILADEATVIRNHKESYLIEPSNRTDFVSLYTALQAGIMGIIGVSVSIFVLYNRDENSNRFAASPKSGWLIYLLLFTMLISPLIINLGQAVWMRRKNSFRPKWILIVANILGFFLTWILVIPVSFITGTLFESFEGSIAGCLCSGVGFGFAQSVGFCFVKRKPKSELS